MTEHQLRVEYVAAILLKPNADNPRLHSRKQRRQIATSIKRFGFTNPILVGDSNAVIAGHGRLEAAIDAGLEVVPVIRLGGLSADEQRALMIADNRIAENSTWDPDRIQKVLQDLVNIQFEVEDLGFDIGEIDRYLGNDADVAAVDDADVVIEPARDKPATTGSGDLFVCGDSRVICGDARDPNIYERLLGSARAGMAFTDPPYNVRIGDVVGRGTTAHREFEMASGELSEAQFTVFLHAVMTLMARHAENGSIHFMCMDWRHLYELLAASKDVYTLKNLCVWTKDNGGMGSLYRSQHELIAVFKSGDGRHINNVELGRKGRYRTNVWRYPGVNTFRRGRIADLQAHPTVKPVAMVADAILDCSRVGDLILDPFLGSGTTLLACQRTQRRAAAIEIDPHYVDTALMRFQQRTGIAPIHEGSGLTFEALMAARLSQGAPV
jgi:DNA modification methylase